MEYALQLLISVLLGFYLGQWLDTKTGKSPWFSLGGLILGIIVGIAGMYKQAMLKQEALKKKKDQSPPEERSS